jgi:hypothetical protein
MSYVHDIGGLHGFGPVTGLDDERSFHAAWEARVFALVRTLIANEVFGWDEFRHAIERMPAGEYFTSGYYERWADAAERLCVEKGVLTAEELAAVRAEMASP